MIGRLGMGISDMGRRHFLIAAVLPSLAAPAAATPPAYLGTWLIAEGHPAPWVDPLKPATAPFDDAIVGKTVTFTAGRIIAPAPLSCRRPAYVLHEVVPEALFQGGLPHPAAEAAALGLAPARIPTLDTNCNAMFEDHFTAAGTALFALNKTIDVLRRR
jgi:hypothetical protein